MRNMSFSKTTEQVRNKLKTVTRRYGWWFLKPGDLLCAVEKGMGLKKGEKVKRICVIEIVDTREESLDRITEDECRKEGFPNMKPDELSSLIRSLCPHWYDDIVNRIEFKYVTRSS